MVLMVVGQDGWMVCVVLCLVVWVEKWFFDVYVFVVLGVVIVVLVVMGFGLSLQVMVSVFGDGFWSLIFFIMQMVFVVIGGYVVVIVLVVVCFIDFLVWVLCIGCGVVVYVGLVSMFVLLFSWGFLLVFGGLLVCVLVCCSELCMDYCVVGVLVYFGLGVVWVMGLSFLVVQLQVNLVSMLLGLVEIIGVLLFIEIIFLWQLIVLIVVLILVLLLIVWLIVLVVGSVCIVEEFLGVVQVELELLQ